MTDKGLALPRRSGLVQSLEEYAAFHGVSPRDARGAWRFEGMRLLGVLGIPALDGPRVAPDTAVPIPFLTPADVIEVEP